jgi:hypothetical protein
MPEDLVDDLFASLNMDQRTSEICRLAYANTWIDSNPCQPHKTFFNVAILNAAQYKEVPRST